MKRNEEIESSTMEYPEEKEGADDGMVCLACGGPVDATGRYAMGGEVEHNSDDGEGGAGIDSATGPKPGGKRHETSQEVFDEFGKALLRRAMRGL